MSTLRVDTIQNRLGGSAISVPGAAKAWVNFNGTGTVAVRASLNVSSLTDNGTGDYTINFTNAMEDANFSAVVAGSESLGNANNLFHHATLYRPSNPFATGSVRVRTGAADSGSSIDFTYVTAAIFR